MITLTVENKVVTLSPQRSTISLTVSPSVIYQGYAEKRMLFTAVSGVITYNVRGGWTQNPTASDDGNGTISIVSDGEFPKTCWIGCNNNDVNFSWVNTSLIELYYPEGYDTMQIEILIKNS